jgi:putative endonuclease
MKTYYVNIMSNKSGTLYTGITNDLEKRVYQHKCKTIEGFTKRYNITQPVFFESTNYITSAIAREKQIKGMLRHKKVELIKSLNPEWKDLSEDWYAPNFKE